MTDPGELPAILGGRPVFPDGPPAWPPAWPEVKAALDAAFADGSWGQYLGPHVRALEADLSEQFGVPHALTCASGTVAVEVALRAVGVGPGDEVILGAYDYESNFLSVHAVGATPILIDVSPDTWGIDPAHVAAAVTPTTKAVLCSHIHGGVVPVAEVRAAADRHGVAVVEDAAQAPLANGGAMTGHARTLSFGGSKVLSAGRGGAVLFREASHHQRAKVWLARGNQLWAPLSELHAAVLRPQLARLPERHAVRTEAVAAIRSALARWDESGEIVRLIGGGGFKAGFRLDPGRFGLSRDLFLRAMRAEGVAFDPGFRALHVGRSPSRFRSVGDLRHAADAHHHAVVLHHPVLLGGAEAGRQVVRAVEKVYRNADRIRTALP